MSLWGILGKDDVWTLIAECNVMMAISEKAVSKAR